MHRVAILALHGVVPFDLSIPCEVFGRARPADGKHPYAVRVHGRARRVRAGLFDMQVAAGFDELDDADTIVVPGLHDPAGADLSAAVGRLRRAVARGARIASICSGSFLLAAAGLLDGRRATTHWRAAAELARRHPRIVVDPDVLFVDEGQIVTSAGASAGIDMCLHLVARDHGQSVVADSARLAVAPLGREGGQRQFILRHAAPHRIPGAGIAATLEWIEARLDRPVSVEEMAAFAGMSKRTFARRFVAETDTTPGQWLIEARTRQARLLLETTGLPLDEVAMRGGFADARTCTTAPAACWGSARAGTARASARRETGGGAVARIVITPARQSPGGLHSHSMVPGGLDVMS
ncbi:MAG: DJ-1/PfpI family protein [Pseudomonadota bacterium]